MCLFFSELIYNDSRTASVGTFFCFEKCVKMLAYYVSKSFIKIPHVTIINIIISAMSFL